MSKTWQVQASRFYVSRSSGYSGPGTALRDTVTKDSGVETRAMFGTIQIMPNGVH